VTAALAHRDAQRSVTDLQFTRFRTLIERLTGIHLADSKKPLLVARLGQRIRELELTDYGDYYERVLADAVECKLMLDRITTNETHFFREPHHFDFLAQRMVPHWLEEACANRRPKRISVWSAGCSTGEEPYSVAMLLASQLPGWDVSILATDLSTRVLATARAAVYSSERITTIPEALRRDYLLRGTGGQRGKIKIKPELRALVRFDRINLTDDNYAIGHSFDLVLCRNVLIYFRPGTRLAVLERLVARLASTGILLLGHAESLPNAGLPMRVVMPTVYERTEPK
jgi:chemotaxis protein methyltransferase CheR